MNRLILGLLLMAAMLGGVGCSSRQIDYSQASPDQPGTTLLILGLFNVFSMGLDDVESELKKDGYHAQTMTGPAWEYLGDQIIILDRMGKLRRPLVLGGHSLGADRALSLAEKLQEAGVTVDYICLLDPTNPSDVPGNVKRCHNIFLSHRYTDWLPAFRGIAVQAQSPQTELVNYDVRYAQTGELSEIDFNHFDIETDPGIQALMVNLIREQLSGDPDFASIFPPNSKLRVE